MTTGWERLAAFEGGNVADLARAQAADGSWHVFAATAVGVFRSVDRGRTWAPLGTGRRVAGAQVVVASPRYAEDGLVFAGAWDGVYRWQDDDASWQHSLTDCLVLTIAIDAGDRDAWPDGSELTLLVGTQEDGILISLDGGRTWAGANAGLLDLCVSDIALSPTFHEDGTAFAATADGLYRTRNGAESWRQLDTTAGDDFFVAVAVSPTFQDDRLVLAGSVMAGMMRSDDGGRSWTEVTADDADDDSDDVDIDIDDEDDQDDDDLEDDLFEDVSQVAIWSGERAVVCTDMGIVLSTDGGQTWRLDRRAQSAAGIKLVSSAVSLPADGDAPDILLAGTVRDGVFRSEDGGGSWARSSDGLLATLVSDLVLSPSFTDDQTVYILSTSNSIHTSADGGVTWTSAEFDVAVGISDGYDISNLAAVLGEDHHLIGQLAVIPTPAGGRALVGATGDGIHLSHDDGEHWQRAWDVSPIAATDSPSLEVSAVATATAPAGVHLLADTQVGGLAWFLIESRDAGKTWAEIPAPNVDTSVLGLALTPDAGLDGSLYVATSGAADGRLTVWHKNAGGQRWQPWFEEVAAPADQRVLVVALPANSWGDTVVLALGERVLRPRPNAWEVAGGARRPVWDATELHGSPSAIAGLTASPDYAQDRTLFAATSAGVCVSRDGGASFTAWSDGLDPAATVAVTLSPSYATDRIVYGLGLGGTVWRRIDE